MARNKQIPPEEAYQITDAEVFMSLVVPAYNEQERMSGMLEEAVEYLEEQYGHHGTKSKSSSHGNLQANGQQSDPQRGWEIIIVSDGSKDKTVETALEFARTHQLNRPAPTPKGPWNKKMKPTNISPGTIRVVQLEQNRGKGGAVTHGMRHARGLYVAFADADGASKFSDLSKLVFGCERAKDEQGRAVGVGSRAHMVGTEAVVKVYVIPLYLFCVADKAPSAPSFATPSCAAFISVSGCSLPAGPRSSAIHSAASSSSPVHPSHTSYPTCIARGGSLTWKC